MPKRTDQITFTRFLAAITIVIYHFGKNIVPFQSEPFSSFVIQAYNLVSYFIILSGFVMFIAYAKYEKIAIKEFYKKRFARVFPLFLFAGIALLVKNKNSISINPMDAIISLSGIQSWIPGKALIFNFPSWAIGCEVFFYLLFPFLYNHILTKANFKSFAIIVILFWLINQVGLHLLYHSELYGGIKSNIHQFMFYHPLAHLNEFLVGNLLGMTYIRRKENYSANYDFLIILCFLFLFLSLKYRPMGSLYHNGLLAIVFVPAILLLALNTGMISKFFQRKTAQYLGEISYAIYILQVPVFGLSRVIHCSLGIQNKTVQFYLYFITLLIMSILAFEFIEKPMRKFINNYGYRKSGHQPYQIKI